MKFLNQLERKYGRYAIPNITLGFIIPQIIFYVLSVAQPAVIDSILLVPRWVMQGQVWRLLTFLFVPPFTNPVFAFFFWYLFYLMGSALEQHWGVFRYNVFLLIGYVATVAVSFVIPDQPSSNGFLQGSVFLAFAYLYPNFVLYIFFVLPVKIKWLALITWIFYGWTLITGFWLERLLVLASICNFLLFFSGDIRDQIRTGRRQMAFQASRLAAQKPEDEPYHRCTVCGITDLTHPDMDFRYCTDCHGTCCYCQEHIFNHPHLQAPENVTPN